MFSHANLVIFNKRGRIIPLNPTSELSIVIPDDFGGSASFYPIVEQDSSLNKTIGGFKKIRGGRFYSDSSTKKARVINGKDEWNYTATVNMVPMNPSDVSTDNISTELYTVDSMELAYNDLHIHSDNLPFPGYVFTQGVLFDKVSVGLHETEYFYVLAERDGVYYKISDIMGEPDVRDWLDHYDLMFFIDCRDQQNFRIFEVNLGENNSKSDEVIWTDRKLVAIDNDKFTSRVDVGFMGEQEGVYEQILHICLLDKCDLDEEGCPNVIPIGEIRMTAEAVGEDERYRTLFENFGIPDPKEFDHVYKDSYTEDDKPDFISINKHSKEMFLSYDQIFPYIGTYKALFNAVKLLGYDDIFFKEWYKVMGVSNEISRGYVAYNMSYKNENAYDVVSALPLEKRINLRKKNWISMLYNLNRELYGKPDEYDFPEVENIYEYRTAESLMKLISLREWLEKYVMALNCHIIDIGGEGIYFERYRYSGYGGIQRNLTYDKNFNVIPTIADSSLKNRFLLKDTSAYIPTRVITKLEQRTFEEFGNARFCDYCEGYIDANFHDYIRFNENEQYQTGSSELYIGDTIAGFNSRLTYKLNAVSTVKNFIFDEGYFSEDSPRLIVRNNTISFLAPDVVTKEKNSAFTKLPLIALEKAVLRSFVDNWEKPIKYTVYPENDPSTGVSYFIENKFNGIKDESVDYIFLTPPTFEDQEDSVIITTKKGDASCSHDKQKHYPFKSDFDPENNTVLEEYTSNNTTYGFRFSTCNAYEIPLFSIQGYTLPRPMTMEIPVTEEFYLDIIKGKLIFDDTDHMRKIYVIFDTDENGKRSVDVKISYFTKEFDICRYTDGVNQFKDFVEFADYQDFADYYNSGNDVVLYSLNHDIKVYNSGIFDVALTVRDIYGEVYCANTSNKAEVYTEQPLLTAYMNEENSNNEFNRDGRIESNDAIQEMFDTFCIFDYKVKNDVLRAFTGDINNLNNTVYPIYPYSGNIADVSNLAHYMNLNDKFKVVAYDQFISHDDRIDWNYYLILNRQSRRPHMRITEKNDVFAINELYSGDPYVGIPNMARICPELFYDAMQNGSENIDVNVMFYNEAGAFPVIQLPGKMVDAKVLDNLHNGILTQTQGETEHVDPYGYDDDEYHLLLSHDITDCYYWVVTDSIGNNLVITRDNIMYTAILFEQDGVEWLLKSVLSEGYGSLWEYDSFSPIMVQESLNKKYAYSNLTYPPELITPEQLNPDYNAVSYDAWVIRENEDVSLGHLVNPFTSDIDFTHISGDASVSFRIPAGMLRQIEPIVSEDPTIPRYRVYSDNSTNGSIGTMPLNVYDAYYAIKPKLLMDRIPDLIKDPNIGIYIYPYWKSEIRIVGVGDNRVLVQYEKDIFPRSFKKGELVKIIWLTGGNPANISQASYKVIGYDVTGLTLILEGEISDAYTVSPDKRYAYSNAPNDGHWDVSEEDWEPKEYEDDPWVEGWLTYDGSTLFTYDYNPEDSFYHDSPLFPEDSVPHRHEYRIPAGHYYDREHGTCIRFRVISHDDLGCPTGENENGMFHPYYAVYDRKADVSTFISYAHNAFTDYKMDIVDVSVNEVGKVGLSHDLSYINDKLTYYIDDTFKVVFRDYDTDNGIMYWMNHTNGKPDICDTSIYSYNCPISIYGKSTNVAFNVDSKTLSDDNKQTILWKVLRSENANMKTLLFESWNKTLFLDIEDKGIYDIEVNTFDKYGNIATHLYEGAYRILEHPTDDIRTYDISCTTELIGGSGDYGHIEGDGEYKEDEMCVLDAYVNNGFEFVGWYIGETCLSTDTHLIFRVHANYDIVAKFDTKRCLVGIGVNNSDWGDASVIGGTYVDEAYTLHYYGDDCTVVATPKSYVDYPEATYKFVNWIEAEDGVVSTEETYTFNVQRDTKLAAIFREQVYTVNANPDNFNYGSVEGTGIYNVGAECTLIANPAMDCSFIGWYDGDTMVSDDPTYVIEHVTHDYNLVAMFHYEKPVGETCNLSFRLSGFDVPSNPFVLSCDEPLPGEYGQKVHLRIDPPTQYGIYLQGWYKNSLHPNNFIGNSPVQEYVLRDSSALIIASTKMNTYNITASIKNDLNYGTVIVNPSQVNPGHDSSVILGLKAPYKLIEYTVNNVIGDMTDLIIEENQSGDTTYILNLEDINEDKVVSFICDIKEIYYPFYIKPKEHGIVKMQYSHNNSNDILLYSFDTITWMNLQPNMEVEVNANQLLFICAKQNINRIMVYNNQATVFEVYNEYEKIMYEIGGNIMSLLYKWGTKFGEKTLNASNRECFKKLFRESRLVNADNLTLPENVAKGCYSAMFENTELRKSPLLRAENLESGCYELLFKNCTELNEIRCNFLDWAVPDELGTRVSCTRNWVSGVTGSGTFYKNPNLEHVVYGDDTVPNGWTILNNNL